MSGNVGGGGRNWEGLGGPISMQPNLNGIDPTLDSCCQKEQECRKHKSLLKQTLRKYDVVAMAERRRRNLVKTSDFTGCRCCYDPNNDGGEYRALIELRQKREHNKNNNENNNDDEVVENNNNGFGNNNNKYNAITTIGDYNKSNNNNDDNDSTTGSNSSSDDEFDYLLDEFEEDDSKKLLEEERRKELELLLIQKEILGQHGYGMHRQMHPSRILSAAGLLTHNHTSHPPPAAVVLHLVDPNSYVSASLDLYLEELCQKDCSRGTKFLRCGGRSTLLMNHKTIIENISSLSGIQIDNDLPALIAIRDGVIVNICPKLHGLTTHNNNNNGDYDDDNNDIDDSTIIYEPAIYHWLDNSGVLLSQSLPIEYICNIRPEEDALMDYLLSQQKKEQKENEELDDDDCYNCGVPYCQKTFFHQHVGIQNNEQDGLVVSKNEIIGNDNDGDHK